MQTEKHDPSAPAVTLQDCCEKHRPDTNNTNYLSAFCLIDGLPLSTIEVAK